MELIKLGIASSEPGLNTLTVVRSIDCYWNRLIASDSSHKPGQKKLVSILGGLNLSGCMEGLVGFSFLELKLFFLFGRRKTNAHVISFTTFFEVQYFKSNISSVFL